MYGEERLIAKLKEFKSKSPKAICELIIEDVQVHNRLIDYSDDKTIVIIRRSR
jgi:serine phosphatase RsbU (regulator of sigma subunit)